jgi:lipoprotein-releasing system ATP-binding protein
MSAIKVSEVRKSLGEPPTEILKGISFDIEERDFVALKGRSGSGKSTLLYILSTLDEPTSGSISIFDRNIRDLSSDELHYIRNTQIGYVFQFHYLLPELSALENIQMPAMKLGVPEANRDRAMELLDLVGLGHRPNNLPRQLSGGECQRVAIARSLMMKPKLLFADEPTGNLDSKNSDMIFSIFRSINEKLNTTIVMVTHDEELAKQTNRIIELKDGLVIDDRKNA